MIGLGCTVIFIIALGVWFIGLIPSNQGDSLRAVKPEDLAYVREGLHQNRGKVLAVVSSHAEIESTGKKAGYELTELSRPYYVFQANGFEVDIASPQGGTPPVMIDWEDMGAFDFAFLNDSMAQQKVSESMSLAEVNPEDYAAIYFAGGKGAMFDFPDNPIIQSMVRDYYQSDKVIGAVCHGPAALVNVILDDGSPLLSQKEVSGFTNDEELLLKPEAASFLPFLLETKMIEQGALFKSGKTYLENVVQDGNLVTGQNPWSTWTFAETMVIQMGYEPLARKKTGEENTIAVLSIYEEFGLDDAKQEVKRVFEQEKPLDRTLLAMHVVVAGMQRRGLKAFELVRLLSYTNQLE